MTGTISCKVKRQFGLRPYDPTPASYAVGKKDFRRSLGFWSDFSLFFPCWELNLGLSPLMVGMCSSTKPHS